MPLLIPANSDITIARSIRITSIVAQANRPTARQRRCRGTTGVNRMILCFGFGVGAFRGLGFRALGAIAIRLELGSWL